MSNQFKDQKIDQLAEVLNVLADPIRMRIILNLTKPASMDDLHQRLDIGQITLARHLNKMQNGGLLRSEQWGSKVYYSLKDAAVSKAINLLLTR